ncbi:Ig-like domain-containing domain [Dyadobacter sp. LHD-138]|uniref:Ig-like domain-containing domain n=1 Tax=Dyadobacter sp. LHD-138 TaxID=3071413 RepID=UPI0027E0786B|nr:Ig-like domain-containing domain [Dyadobacter sp. LHD-138]MDQ6482397.1 Ig-like domain-containing domain [Dyadobacter sp. LHD-138]
MLKKYFLLIACIFLLSKCAQVVAPTGGKKDIIPPNLIESIPPNRTLNFKDNKISLFFDEYVIIDNITQKLIITPEADNPYSFKQKGTSVELNFKKKFQDSTTYTLNFGDAIKDYAEKNPAKNLKLVFSTGSSLDSGRIYGTVKDLRSNKPIFDALVGLYNISDTLNIVKQKPFYFSRTDSSGRFTIENAQVKDYKLFALDDKNRNLLYNAKDERIGFLSKPVNAGSDSLNYNLSLFLSDNTPFRVQRTIPKVNNYTVVFNKGVEKVDVHFMNKDTIPYVLENNIQLKFFNVQPHPDTTYIRMSVTDSLGITAQDTIKITFQQQRGKERQRDAFTMTSLPQQNKPLSKIFEYELQLSKPVSFIDDKKIQLITDSLTKEPLSNFKWTWNKFHNQIKISGKSAAKDSIKWEFPKGSFISVEGDTLAKMLIKHPVLNEDDYGILRGAVNNADSSAHFIIELVDQEYKTLQSLYTSPYTFRHIPQGNYFLRLILDTNNNKRWDTGLPVENRQPEKIIYLPEKLLIKANFEINDTNFDLSTLKD